MIRRIILFLGLLFVAFFAYRRYNPTSADALLSKIKTFSFKNSGNDTYTTTIDGKAITTGDTSDDILSGGIITIDDTTKTSTSTGSNTDTSGANALSLYLLSQAQHYAIIAQMSTGTQATTGSSNDDLIGEIIGKVIENTGAQTTTTSTPTNQTGTVTTTGTTHTLTLQEKLEAAKAKAGATTATNSNTTTSPSTTSTPLSSQDKEEASDFLGAFSQD